MDFGFESAVPPDSPVAAASKPLTVRRAPDSLATTTGQSAGHRTLRWRSPDNPGTAWAKAFLCCAFVSVGVFARGSLQAFHGFV